MPGYYTPPGIVKDDPEFQRREEEGLSVLSMHLDEPENREATRREIEEWYAEQFPGSTLFWAGGGNMFSNGRMWNRWLPEDAVKACVLRLFWG